MIGDLSAKYESNGNPGAISTGEGDLGGKSYGCYQLALRAGAVECFQQWLKETGHTYGQTLGTLQAGSSAFDQLWVDIASVDSENFKQLQYDYISFAYYEPAVELLQGNDFIVEKHMEIMKDVIWSRAVQFGAGNIVELFTEAVIRMGHPNLSYVDAVAFDGDLITNIYDFLIEECDNAVLNENGLYHSPKDWANGSYDVVKIGLRNRFEQERNEALAQI